MQPTITEVFQPDLRLFPSRRAILLDVALLLAVAAFFGMGGGAPFYHPDTLVEKALRTLVQAGDPKFFNYPALQLYLNGFVYQGWLNGLIANGTLPGAVTPVDWYVSAVRSGTALAQSAFVPGQIITLLYSLLGVACTYLTALRLTRSRAASLAAGLILCTCLLWATDAHYITVDTPLAGLGMAAIALTLFFSGHERPLRIWQLVLLGLLAGLTTSAKYNGALVLLAISGALYLDYSDHWQWFKHMCVVGGVALAAFYITNPFIFLGSQKFFSDFQYEMNHTRLGHPGFSTDNAALFHLQTTLPLAYGWLVLGLAAAGLIWLIFARRISWAHKLGFLVYPAAGFALIGSSHLAFQRYMLPFLPFIAVLASLALFAIVTEVRRRNPRLALPVQSLALMLLLAAVGGNARNVLQSNWLLTQTDTRDYFVKIIQASGLAGARGPGFAGMYTDLYFNFRFKGGQGDANRANLLVLDSFSHDRWLYDASTRLDLRKADYASSFTVVQITPFTRSKAEVPLSVQSIYSPYLPDLYERARPGPFIEIYLRDTVQADALMVACRESGAPCTRLAAEEGYYFQNSMK